METSGNGWTLETRPRQDLLWALSVIAAFAGADSR
jgi:hypothetical protein